MKIYINGVILELPNASKQSYIDQVLTNVLPINKQQQSFALALNGEFIGREDYQHTVVKDNDSIDVLFPIVGG
ncbi:MAG: sulfur carrier protein ThiS [Colwellia polaris]|jgi:sulfur carrier protein|uniref:sulfur carrier protein ThiS n=1 Tax=Colwellia polaris TaxID=326537 RepID=UPI000A178090|nr:sulfur carrier protein ThiS [Colwellia polaris]|tara:strand:+ start:1101 stop:1319 length:219 start_codon:yes stop_codon:yes gene_type:complete